MQRSGPDYGSLMGLAEKQELVGERDGGKPDK